MWIQNGERVLFSGGKTAFAAAAAAAERCPCFSPDCEEESEAEEEKSCYNCRWRRWTAQSFECIKRCKP